MARRFTVLTATTGDAPAGGLTGRAPELDDLTLGRAQRREEPLADRWCARRTCRTPSGTPTTRPSRSCRPACSHDLRNPLGSILISAAAMRDSSLPDRAGEGARAAASRIQRSAVRMDDLIRDLLDFSRIEAHTLAMNPADHRIEDIIADEWGVLEALANEKKIQLKRTDTPGLVRCDRMRIAQVIENLVGNAIKFTPVGGRVRVGTETAGSYVRVFVEDTGCGIAEEDQPRTFDRYWKGRGSSSEGAGLGLAIAKAIVEAHGGKLEVESRPGVGSRFAFALAGPVRS